MFNLAGENIMSDFYFDKEELLSMGVREIGENCTVSRKCSIYPGERGITLGNNVRIDDFCLLVGNITVGNYVHIGAFSGLHASKSGHILFRSFSGISSNVHIYANSDRFDGEFITAKPGLPEGCIDDVCCEVVLGEYSQIGTSSVVLPQGSLGEGTAVGAMSLVNKPLDSWKVYAGIPCKFIRTRSRKMLNVLNSKGIIPPSPESHIYREDVHKR